MLCDIYDGTKVQGEFDTDFIRSAVFGEKIWSIPWKYSGIPFDDQVVPEVVKEVIDILDMWSSIEHSVAKLDESQRARLEREAAPFGQSPKFMGFDGNSETQHMSTAAFFVNQLDRFTEFKGRDFNSHMPVVDSYKRMLQPYLAVRNKLAHGPLEVDDLVTILKELTHPENRE